MSTLLLWGIACAFFMRGCDKCHVQDRAGRRFLYWMAYGVLSGYLWEWIFRMMGVSV